MTDIIEKIIDAAIHAPSGDNCQPWQFQVKNNSQILFYLIPDRDQSLYSWGQRASLIALGAAIENAVITGSQHGYKILVELLPTTQNPNLVAQLTLTQTQTSGHPLYPFVLTRCTNRKPYKKIPLTNEQKDFLKNIDKLSDTKIKMVYDNGSIKQLAKAASANEKILFENFHMHQFFYSHINWTSQEELKKRLGFYIKTLEVPAFAMPSFKLAKNWKILKWLNKFGFSNIIAKENTKTYNSCASIGAMIMPDNSPHSYINAGRLFEQVWLSVTSQKLQLQPLTGTCLLMQKILNNSVSELSNKHQKIVRSNYNEIKTIFGVKDETIALLFRVGYGEEPSARTLRLSPQIIES